HKYDPITTKDFYSLGAFFADISEAPIGRREDGMLVPNEEQAIAQKKLETDLAGAEAALDRETPQLATAQVAWEKSIAEQFEKHLDWHELTPNEVSSREQMELRKDGNAVVLRLRERRVD